MGSQSSLKPFLLLLVAGENNWTKLAGFQRMKKSCLKSPSPFSIKVTLFGVVLNFPLFFIRKILMSTSPSLVVFPNTPRTESTLPFSCSNHLLSTELFSHFLLQITMISPQLGLPHFVFETLVKSPVSDAQKISSE